MADDFNVPRTDQKRIVILGAGFGGLKLATKLSKSNYQVVLIDRNNYHQFQPLFYQVAMAGLEPSSISFPLRKLFQKKENIFLRVGEVEHIDLDHKIVYSGNEKIHYDHLVNALGAKTNFYGNAEMERRAYGLKSVSEALQLRNAILQDYEKALLEDDYDRRQSLIDIVIVGGGATGVELAGSLAEMKNYILPKDYRELNIDEVDIYLIQGAPVLLDGMSKEASEKAEEYLIDLGVKVIKNTIVKNFDGENVFLSNGQKILTDKVIWAAGVISEKISGLPQSIFVRGNRIHVDQYNKVKGAKSLYALGDIAYMETPDYPQGHPQVAQVAMQQAVNLANNFKNLENNRDKKKFKYKDLGSLATIGRNKAVADLPHFKFQGFFAWVTWLFVHLFQLIGAKNKIVVFINWIWNYITYDHALRLIIKPKGAKEKEMLKEGSTKLG